MAAKILLRMYNFGGYFKGCFVLFYYAEKFQHLFSGAWDLTIGTWPCGGETALGRIAHVCIQPSQLLCTSFSRT